MNLRAFRSLVSSYSGPAYLAPIPRVAPLRNASIVCSVKTIGVSAQDKALKNWYNKIGAAAERGVKKAIQFLLDETLPVTPFAFGTLRKSGKTDFQNRGQEMVGIVYFDDTEAPYGIYVHEDLTKYHKPPTMAKFLQRTQYKNRARISLIIREEIAKARL